MRHSASIALKWPFAGSLVTYFVFSYLQEIYLKD